MTETKKSLLHIIPSNRWGGIQAYALDICRHYNARGWQVTALTRNAVGVDAPFAEAGIELVHAPLNGSLDISTAMILARRLRRMPQDGGVVHVHRYRDAFAVIIAKKIAKRPDIRVVSTRHAVRRGRDTFLFRKLYKLIDAHIFVSAMAYDAFRHAATRNIKLPPDSVYILRNSLNIPAGEPAPEPSTEPQTEKQTETAAPEPATEAQTEAILPEPATEPITEAPEPATEVQTELASELQSESLQTEAMNTEGAEMPLPEEG